MWQELKKLGLPKEEFRFSKLSEELVLNPADPVENVRLLLNYIKLGKRFQYVNAIIFSSAEVSLSSPLLLLETYRP